MLQEMHVHLTVEAQEQGPRGTELNFKRQAEVSQAGKSKGSQAARTDARVDAEARRSQTIAKLGCLVGKILADEGHTEIRLEEL